MKKLAICLLLLNLSGVSVFAQKSTLLDSLAETSMKNQSNCTNTAILKASNVNSLFTGAVQKKSTLNLSDKNSKQDKNDSEIDIPAIKSISEEPAVLNQSANQNSSKSITRLMTDEQVPNHPRECAVWGSEEVCVNQEICELVCTIVGAGAGSMSPTPGGAIGSQIITQTCNNVCKTIPKCTSKTVCKEWK